MICGNCGAKDTIKDYGESQDIRFQCSECCWVPPKFTNICSVCKQPQSEWYNDKICVDCYFSGNPKAVRHNEDKLRVDLIPPKFIEEVARVFTFGAKKYSPNNWKGFNEQQKEEIIGSLLRHILEFQKGNKLDSESGLHHLAHAACNIAFILYFEEDKND